MADRNASVCGHTCARTVRRLLCPLLVAALAACGGGDNHHGRRATATPTAAASATATSAVNASATPTPAVAETATATVSATANDTALVHTATATPSASSTETPPATPTPSDTQTPTATPSVTATNTQTIVGELAGVGLGKYLGIMPTSTTTQGVWEHHFYDQTPQDAICLDGGQYQVEVHHGTNNKVMLMLEGGGACWSYDTCWGHPLGVKVTSDPYPAVGVLDFSNPDNPFADWNVVYAPYCDGSVFAGDNIVDYQNGATSHHTFHHGQQNISAAITLMQSLFPNPDQIVVSGYSAGGYGTFTGYGVTRVAFPDTPILTLDDSGPGLQNSADTQNNQDRINNWKFTQYIPASCTQCATQESYLSSWALDRDLALRIGLFSNLQDGVIRTFINLDPDAYEALLLQVSDDVHTHAPDRFKRFFIQGSGHTIVELPTFYNTEVAGISLRDWTADFLTNGPKWQDLVEGFNPDKLMGYSSPRYKDPSLWLCRPDLATNQCLVNDLQATAVEPDDTLVVDPQPTPVNSDYDCFYIYPTVDLSGTPGNHTDFSDISYELDPLLSQAARFNGSCRIFAPLYRQVTIGTYSSSDPNTQHYFDIAYGDVEEAFHHYMGQYNNGRNVVIMGHSQGTFMTTELIQKLIDGEPRLRARLITALLIGGSVTVPDGQTVGGTFQNLPLCTDADQTGCVIAYRSYADGFPPANGSNVVGPDGMDTACTNPAALANGGMPFASTYLPLHVNQPLFQVGMDIGLQLSTPFAVYHDFYTGQCVKDDHGRSYLQIGYSPAPGDQRMNLIPLNNPLFAPNFLGTHVLDYNWALGDLIDLVQRKAAALKAQQAITPPPPS